MKKQLFTSLLFFFLLISNAKAQFVTIPDPYMVSWLTAHYPSAMVGNQLDTTNALIVNETAIQINTWVENLDGIQYFDNAIGLYASGHFIDTIPAFPNNLLYIYISTNTLSSLPELPTGLKLMRCDGNQIDSLPNLPISLDTLECQNNNLTFLPALPSSLDYLNCGSNNLTVLPVLPNSLMNLFCYSNNLTLLPNLPDSMHSLNLVDNNLTSLPELPSYLLGFGVNKNLNLNCLPILPQTLLNLGIDSTNILCLPNYPSQLMSIDVSGLPLCEPNNQNGCITAGLISGAVFIDASSNCINTANLMTNTVFHLLDNQNNFLQSRSSSINDNYYFSIQPGGYVVRTDSSFSTNSVAINCPLTGEHMVTALLDSTYTDRDFGISCVGTDVGVEAIVQQGIVFPGQPHSVKALAGDLSNYFGLNCAAGTGGSVQLTVNGPVSFTGFPSAALAPTVSGNTYSYAVSDFGLISIGESFVLNFVTDTTAQTGDAITVTATITSNSTDMDSTNNFLSNTYNVVNSYDPNMKEVNPTYVLPGYDDYFTYTVHFQNLGSAPAFNIKIKDTLDVNLDFSTFRVINASHNYSYNLSGDLLTVYFPNIQLADSASNPEGSKGFVQYQVKPKSNMPLGTTIENTAHIYFDFNSAVVTNTTMNQFVNNLSVTENSNEVFSIFPNPSSGSFSIVNANKGNESLNIQVFDLLGKKLIAESLTFKNGVASLHTELNSGSYILLMENNEGVRNTYRLVVEK
ncbi:MAG: DUF7619 domain-containing protein [Bacteroidota bacterium]